MYVIICHLLVSSLLICAVVPTRGSAAQVLCWQSRCNCYVPVDQTPSWKEESGLVLDSVPPVSVSAHLA